MSSTQSESVSKPSDESAAEVVLSREAVAVAAAVAAVAALPITNQAELDALGAGVKSVSSRLKEIEAWRQSYTSPLLEQVEAYRAQARPAEAAYEALKQAIKSRMLRYKQECAAAELEAREVAQAAQLQAHAAAQAGQGAQAQALQTTAFQALQGVPVAMVTAGIATVRQWAIRVTKPELVPERFKTVDEGALLAHVRATLGKASEHSGAIPDMSDQGFTVYVAESIRA
jgi:hypothetical protein